MSHHTDPPTVTVLTGAGISTSAGIPDFRGPQGVWTHHPEQERLLDLRAWSAQDDVRVQGWAMWRDHPAWSARPGAGHRALTRLQQAGALRGLLTQNFDGLHQAAGTSDVRELHGTLATTSCLTCRRRQPAPDVLARLDEEPDPRCPRCGGVLKPDVVYFGEALDERVLESAVAAAQDAQVFVAVGTTLGVQPVAGLAAFAVDQGARLVVVNDGPTAYDHLAERLVRDPIDEALPALVDALIAQRASR